MTYYARVFFTFNTFQIHPNYTFGEEDGPKFDVALITMSESLSEFSERAHPVCLPKDDDDDEMDIRTEAEMTGWASKSEVNECGYAWYDEGDNTWYHTPPRHMHEGTINILN